MAQLNSFQLLERCTDLLVSTRNTVLWYPALPADKYEANIKSVADNIKSSVAEVKGITGKNTTNGPDGTVSSKTASSVQMLSNGARS